MNPRNSAVRWRQARARLLVVLAMGATASCAVARRPAAPGTESADFLEGVVRLVGPVQDSHVVITNAASQAAVAVSGADASLLRALTGVEVAAWGRRNGDGLALAGFLVTRVDGVPVLDGILRAASGGYVLHTTWRNIPLANAPVAFARLVGTRIWVQIDAASAVAAHGTIQAPR